MKIIIDRDIPFIQGLFEPYAEVVYLAGRDIDSEAVADCDALIVRTRTRCDEKLLKDSPVRFIATATIGTDHIDTAYCFKRGIIVANAAGCNARGVLQWVAAVLCHITKRRACSPNGLKLGVVGVGNVGSLVAHYAAAWGFEVLKCDPPRAKREEDGDFREYEELLRECDILTFHTPLDATTRHMLAAKEIKMLKPDAVIINASRGEVVDNRVVAKSGHDYYFDVWEGEPDMAPDVLDGAQLATPHIAGYSRQGKANATAMVVRALASMFGFRLGGWYPADVTPTTPREIGWEEMCSTINNYCNLDAETAVLKSSPEKFEALRNGYNYREEYF